jgi:predicted phosphoribosyltransferase
MVLVAMAMVYPSLDCSYCKGNARLKGGHADGRIDARRRTGRECEQALRYLPLFGSRSVNTGRFRDRRDAGRLLASKLTRYANRPDVLVLALPRGGVPVAYEVAQALGAPLEVFLVRKLGVPGHEELAMGAVATGGVRVLNHQVVAGLGISDEVIDAVTAREQQELARREGLYRGDRPPPDVRGRTVILVDDGLATGASMHAAIKAMRALQPARIVVAVPAAAPETCSELRAEVDDVICAVTPVPFHAVGLWYEDFSQTNDDEVRELLARAATGGRAA